jgi:hypothetical protein
MIKSTILKFFEQPLYIVQAKLSGKVYIPCLHRIFGASLKLLHISFGNPKIERI